MKKLFALLIFFSATLCAQQPVQVNYDQINQEFQKQLQTLIQSYVESQASQGYQSVVSFYDNFGEERASYGNASCPSSLKAISDYKVQFLKSRQLQSTSGVFYFGEIRGAMANGL